MTEYIVNGVIVLYVMASALILVYGLHCYVMIAIFMTRQKKGRAEVDNIVGQFECKDADLPFVTFQLPVYNEAEVIGRLIASCARVDYPMDRFEIQVVDDSSDETIGLIDTIISSVKAEYNVDLYAVRRTNRIGYKAGALEEATKIAKGDFIAIFDSDFIVPENFLRRSVSQIVQDDKIACVQGRWGHVNRNENWLTKAQSVGIDGHFAAEQGARSYSGMCMNFNGTAGLWRKTAIDAGGGWEHDTLTEDLDLSYRVQMAGFSIKYDFDLLCEAEIPNNITALKSQQRRWAKGSIETAIKLMPRILSSQLTFSQKIEAFLHMTHYTVAVLMLLLSLLTMPVVLYAPTIDSWWLTSILWPIIIIGAIAPCVMYTGSGFILGHTRYSLSHFPSMLAMGTGLCVNNALAVLDAFTGRKTEFVRTPKSGSSGVKKRKGRYKANTNLIQGLIEFSIGVYCLITLVFYLRSENYMFGFFIGAYSVGLITFGFNTLSLAVMNLFTRDKNDSVEQLIVDAEPAID